MSDWSRPMELMTVISGGQTGVDRAALRAARMAGLEIGGWCPPGRAAEDGRIPQEFPLKETPADRSEKAPHVPRSQRTEWNVRDADATLVLIPGESDDAGTNLSVRFARELNKPVLVYDLMGEQADESIGEWLERNVVRTLNVAGPSESAAPGITDEAYELLMSVFTR
ncbi:MAG TPA: putative molybdenum carrier protein [Longimicrobiales bacterium]